MQLLTGSDGLVENVDECGAVAHNWRIWRAAIIPGVRTMETAWSPLTRRQAGPGSVKYFEEAPARERHQLVARTPAENDRK